MYLSASPEAQLLKSRVLKSRGKPKNPAIAPSRKAPTARIDRGAPHLAPR